MQAERYSQENSPHHARPSAECQQGQPNHDHRNVMVFAEPDLEFILSQIGCIASHERGLVVQGVAGKNPAGMGTPAAIMRSVWIPFGVGQLMMNTVGSHPENRSAFQCERAAD